MPQINGLPGGAQTAPPSRSRFQKIEVDPRLAEQARLDRERAIREAGEINGPRDWLEIGRRWAEKAEEFAERAVEPGSPVYNAIRAGSFLRSPVGPQFSPQPDVVIPGRGRVTLGTVTREAGEAAIEYGWTGFRFFDAFGYDLVFPRKLGDDNYYPPSSDGVAGGPRTPRPGRLDQPSLPGLGEVLTSAAARRRLEEWGRQMNRGGFSMLPYSSRDPV